MEFGREKNSFVHFTLIAFDFVKFLKENLLELCCECVHKTKKKRIKSIEGHDPIILNKITNVPVRKLTFFFQEKAEQMF